MKGSNYPYIALAKKLLTDRRIFACLSLALILFIATPMPAHAIPGVGWVVDQLATGAGVLIASIAGAIFWLLNWVGFALLALAATLLETVMVFVLSVAYTPLNAGPTHAITTAWELMRDFANMLFILILMAVGVGTMLGMKVQGQEVSAKLLLPFVLIATLINFTPLITGVVIDISNILTKFFFDVSIGGANIFLNENPFRDNAGNLGDVLSANLDVSAAFALQMVVAFIFNLLTSLILITVSFLLIMRVLALWLLVIFSPLAFTAYILPQTRSYFKLWWGQFLQWAMLPVTLGLFLWVAALILSAGSASCSITKVGQQTTSGYYAPANEILQGKDGNAFCSATMSLMALGTIVVGMTVGFATSAKGSSYIINQATKTRQDAQKWANQRRIQGQQAAGRAAKRTVREGVSVRTPGFGAGALRRREAAVPGIKNVPNKLAKGAGLPVIGGAVGAASAGIQRWVNQTSEKELEVESARYKGLSDDQKLTAFKNERNPRRVAALLKDLQKEKNDEVAGIIEENPELKNLVTSLREAAKSNTALATTLKDFQQKNAHLSDDIAKTVGKMKPSDITNLSGQSLQDPRVLVELLRQNKFTPGTVQAIGQNPKKFINLADGLDNVKRQEGWDDAQLDKFIKTTTSPGSETEAFRMSMESSPAAQALYDAAKKAATDRSGAGAPPPSSPPPPPPTP